MMMVMVRRRVIIAVVTRMIVLIVMTMTIIFTITVTTMLSSTGMVMIRTASTTNTRVPLELHRHVYAVPLNSPHVYGRYFLYAA